MKLSIMGLDKTEKGSIELPQQFSEPVNRDLIKRAVLALQANKRQPYGAKPTAGKRQSAKISRRRRNYKGSYGMGISRVPRKTMSRSGRRFMWMGAFAPGTVGGRRAHPPKAEKIWAQKINKQENRKAIRSAIAATLNKELVAARGHKAPEAYPFVLGSGAETIQKTKEAAKALAGIGFEDELIRASKKTIRAGKGKMRGRRYVTKKGLLLVVAKSCELMKAARNLPGIEIVEVNRLNAELLAPGTAPGRMTLFTESAIERLGKERLFE
ncbi:50S ribosomal protein L4 [Candidatus Woesearchaeota archaeon]|nr:50S ribosomal protein L4 [Candidatus Woesearchaeota archaeon]